MNQEAPVPGGIHRSLRAYYPQADEMYLTGAGVCPLCGKYGAVLGRRGLPLCRVAHAPCGEVELSDYVEFSHIVSRAHCIILRHRSSLPLWCGYVLLPPRGGWKEVTGDAPKDEERYDRGYWGSTSEEDDALMQFPRDITGWTPAGHLGFIAPSCAPPPFPLEGEAQGVMDDPGHTEFAQTVRLCGGLALALRPPGPALPPPDPWAVQMYPAGADSQGGQMLLSRSKVAGVVPDHPTFPWAAAWNRKRNGGRGAWKEEVVVWGMKKVSIKKTTRPGEALELLSAAGIPLPHEATIKAFLDATGGT